MVAEALLSSQQGVRLTLHHEELLKYFVGKAGQFVVLPRIEADVANFTKVKRESSLIGFGAATLLEAFLIAQQRALRRRTAASFNGLPPRCSETSKPTAVLGTFRFQRCALVGPPSKPASPGNAHNPGGACSYSNSQPRSHCGPLLSTAAAAAASAAASAATSLPPCSDARKQLLKSPNLES